MTSTETGTQTELRFNPFPGLRTFEPGEDYLFFGREVQIDELLRRLRTTRFLSIVGTSGSGKSSLVRAGLIPSLHGGAMTRAGSSWRVAILRPGEDPIGNLAAALAGEEALGTGSEPELARAFFATTLRASNRGLVDCIRQSRLPPRANVLVLADQFEEVFRFKHNRRLAGRDEAVAFVKLLLEAARDPQVPCYIALTMRSDFIGDCMEFGELPETINAGLYLVPRMTREELRLAIKGPVAVGGGEISLRLVSRLLNDVGDDPDQLPILQHALLRTWERWEETHVPGEPLDLRHYEAIGTMASALSRHAEEAYKDLTEERARIARVLFCALTDKSTEGRGIRRPAPLAEICALAVAAPKAVISVVERFRRPGRSFLMPPPAVPLHEGSILDLSHESLMRIWERLAGWVDEEARSARLYVGVARAAARHAEGMAALWRDPELQLALSWREREAPTEAWARRYDPSFARAMAFLDDSRAERDRELEEKEKQRRSRRRRERLVMAVLLVFSLATAILGGVAYVKMEEAEVESEGAKHTAEEAKRAEKEANAQKRKANQQQAIAEQQQHLAETERANALHQSRAADEQKRRAEVEQRKAQVNEADAQHQKLLAEAARSAERGQREQAEEQRRQAEQARLQAEGSEQQAQRLSRVTLAHALALQVVRPQPQDQWETSALLALQAYRLHRDNGGAVEDPDLFNALRVSLGHLRPDEVLRGHLDGVRAVAMTPDGRSALSGGEDGKLLRFDLGRPESAPSPLGALASPIRALALAADGDRLAVAGAGGELQLWSLRRPDTPPVALATGGGVLQAAAFQPGGAGLAAGGTGGFLRLWDAEHPQAAAVPFDVDGRRVAAVAFSPDGATLAAGLAKGGALLWSVRQPAEAPRPACAGLDLRSLALSPDGRWLACGGSRGEILLTPLGRSGAAPYSLPAHASAVNSLRFDAKGERLASASSDGTVRLWDLARPHSPSIVLPGHEGWVWSVAFTPDGRHLVSGSEDRTLRLWPARTEVLVRELCGAVRRGLTREEWALALPPDLAYAGDKPCPTFP